MMTSLKYKEQVNLLLEVIEPVLDDNRLALKGGTAINLFTMNLPRFSVDLDLIYLPVTGREEFLEGIKDVFKQMEKRLMKFSPEIIRTSEGIPKQMRLSKGKTDVKAEVNLVLRGTIYPPEEKELCRKAQTEFEKSVKILCASFEDQYAGKFCAALDRQHPRDLFDVKLFFENFNLTEKLKKAFLVYLISGNRPIHEMIRPNLLDQRRLFTEQFQGMSDEKATYEELVAARAHLIQTIEATLTDDDRTFLLSLKKGNPEWELLGLNGVESLPGVRWKLMNIKKMRPEKHKEAIAKLENKLS
jgi:predicted nucleotidyltransferase component of viral defense system